MKKWQFIVVLFAVLTIMGLMPTVAHAAPGGRSEAHGYFDGKNSTDHNWDNVFKESIPSSVNTKAEFISWAKGHLKDSDRDKLGAAFIINLMLGKNGSSADKTPSAAAISDWEDRINDGGIAIHRGSISWGSGKGADVSGWNSAYASDINDEIFYGDSGSHEAIYFTDAKGNILFVVKTDCGNPLGDLAGLPVHVTPPPDSNATASATAACNTNGTAKVTFNFYDKEKEAGAGHSLAYYKVNLKTAGYGASTSQASLEANDWTSASDTGNNNNLSITVPASQANGTYGFWIYVQDVKVNGSNTWPAISPSGYARAGSWPIPTCDRAPTISATPSCVNGITGSAQDPDRSTSEMVVELLKSDGTHVYSVTTKSHAYQFTRANLGTAVNWNSASYIVRAQGVNSGGAAGTDTDKTVTVGPCADVACGANADLSGATVGVRKTFTVFATTNATNGTPPTVVPGFTVTVNGQSATADPTSIAYSNGTFSEDFSFIPPAPATYTVVSNWGNAAYSAQHVHTNSATGCGGSGFAAFTPYFDTLGADIAAGPGFGDTCTPNKQAGIYGSIRENDNNGNPLYYGSASQLAALALSNINGFATSSVNNTSAGTSRDAGAGRPSGLAFANDPLSASSYGGNFKRGIDSAGNALAGGWCATDYVGKAVNDSSVSPTVYGSPTSSAGTVTIAPGMLAAKTKSTIVIYGNAYIPSNVTYAGYGVNALADMPQFKLLVMGNIYIAPTVTTLRGQYVAQPSAVSNTGGFYSCATSDGTAIHDYATCNHQLTVYGAVAAKSLKLDRTYGNLIAAAGVTAEPSEKFVFTPELWLADLQTGNTGTCATKGTNCKYDAFTSLPPVLK